ncbi:hypothetical protein AAG570_008294 [Ranatra chinensis]|uniref:Cystathionine beta-synthase n=1 Tax=Ranatra chinensis TaxID=642074 RepID=A0ABD0XU65_9HEMI
MEGFIAPNKPSRCTWHPKTTEKSPHACRTNLSHNRMKILPNILHAIGDSPMVRLNHIPQAEGIKCEMLAKCEFLNPGGSVKDRIGFRMVQEAQHAGLLNSDSTIIEPTSGNTGLGLAMASAVFGYKCIIVMPKKMSDEKVCALKALGAKIIRTPTEAAFDSPEGLIAVAQKLNREIPNSIILNQYTNPGNPLAHYDGTGVEILTQCDNKLDMVVIGAGTGGTVTGVGRYIKDKLPSVKVVAVDPYGSILAEPPELNVSDVSLYEIEGIGYDFIPTVLDRSAVDQWVKTGDKESFIMSRRLIKEEGLLCGGSSGAAMVAALKVARELNSDQRCVVLLPDGIRNYMSKMAKDEWMVQKGFYDQE